MSTMRPEEQSRPFYSGRVILALLLSFSCLELGGVMIVAEKPLPNASFFFWLGADDLVGFGTMIVGLLVMALIMRLTGHSSPKLNDPLS